jgi:hypothetical protein
MPPPSGNLSFVETAMSRLQQDIMGLVGMTTPTDTFTPEVMSPGNSGAKLQLAMGPNQLIQDNIIKNCAQGLEDALWLVWRTLVQYSDDYGVKKLAAQFHPDKLPVFMDGESYDNMDFCERKIIHIDLAVGMASEENSLQRIQAIKQAQTALAQEVMAGVQANIITPESFKKMRRPYEDMMYVLGVKDANTYLLTEAPKLYLYISGHPTRPDGLTPAKQKHLLAVLLETLYHEEAEILVKIINQSIEFTIDPKAIYEKYTGSNRIVVDDNSSGILIDPDRIKIYREVTWSENLKVPV